MEKLLIAVIVIILIGAFKCIGTSMEESETAFRPYTDPSDASEIGTVLCMLATILAMVGAFIFCK